MNTFPVWAEVDVVVVGGSVAGLAAALAAVESGARVAVLAERTYVGDDVAGTFELWPGGTPRHALARALWPDGQPCTPLQAKALLEGALVEAGCPFLVGTGLTHVLRDAGDCIAGALVATSGGALVVTARVVVDATRYGLVLKAMGHADRTRGPLTAGLVVLGESPAGATRLGPVTASSRWNADRTVMAWQATAALSVGEGTPREWGRLDADLRNQIFTPGQLRAADLLTLMNERPAPAAWVEDGVARAPGPGMVPAERFEAGARLGLEAARRARALVAGPPARAECHGAQPMPGLGWLPVAPRFAQAAWVHLPGADHLPEFGAWEVAVLGGGTSGAPAGLAAARERARVLVMEAAPGLGGVGTQGMIGSYFAGNRVGFTRLIDQGVAAMGPDGPPAEAGRWNVEWKAAWYLRELRAADAEVWLGVRGAGMVQSGGQLRGVVVTTPWGAGQVACGVAVDASGSAALAAAAGAPVNTVGVDHVAVQGSGLGPRELAVHNRNNDWTFVDDGDPVDLTRAFVAARSKWRGEFDVAQIVDMRERRRICAEVDLDMLDILAGRTFPDTIAVARAPFETHGLTIHPVFVILPPPGKESMMWSPIPLRALLPRGVEGLLVVGLGLGAHRDAVTVIRMQADVQNIGWAAGRCAVFAIRTHGGRVRAVAVRTLQQVLVEGGSLGPECLQQQDAFPVSDAVLDQAVAGGLEDHRSLALLLAHADRALPRLRAALAAGPESAVRQRLAICLGMLGDDAAADELAARIAELDWDAGWTFAGMEQWGHSLSPVDSLLIALGRTGARHHAPVVAQKIAALDAGAALSHARAVALSATGLGDPALGGALKRLLELTGMRGHHQGSLADAAAEKDRDPNANRDRNDALRELFLARALWQLGDQDGVAERILQAYASDLRGHFSRHAAAVLAEPTGSATGWTCERRLRLA